MTYTIGVDVGGTKVAAGVVDEEGKVLVSTRRPTPSESPDHVEETIAAVVTELRREYDVEAVGIGAAGFVDVERSTVLFAPNLVWRGEPLRDDIAARIGLPVVVGELLVGVVLGSTGIGTLDASEPTFAFLAQVGFALVMFVAGSHVPVRDPALRQGIGPGLARAFAIGLLAVPVGLLLAHLVGTDHGGLYAVLLASSSAALILPIISFTGASGRVVLELLPQVAVADAACIVALPLAIDPAHAARALVGGLAVLVGAAGVFLSLRWVERSGVRHRVHHVSQDRKLALELRVSLTLLFALAALAVALQVSVLVAGFAFGLAVAAVGEPRRLAKQLFAITEGFLGPLFFVWLGASLNLRDLVAHPAAIGLGLGLGVGAVAVHALMALTRQPLPVAVLTSAQLGVPVAAATLGGQLGLLGPGEAAALLLGALVTIAATTVAAAALRRPAGLP